MKFHKHKSTPHKAIELKTARFTRAINPNGGRPVFRRIGFQRNRLSDIYHFLLKTSWPILISLMAAVFISINLIFAGLYYLGGASVGSGHTFLEAFFFSVQTFATIGYGQLYPHDLYSNILVTIEAFLGILSVAMITGLLFAKFSKPTARVVFSKVAVVTPRDGIPSLMFRMANGRTNRIVQANLEVHLVRSELTKEGEFIRKFYDLKLARQRTPLFALTWMAFHPITPDSPLYGQTAQTMLEDSTEIIVSFTGIDDTYMATVHSQYSYTVEEIVWDRRFDDIFRIDDKGIRIMDYTRFHDVIPVNET